MQTRFTVVTPHGPRDVRVTADAGARTQSVLTHVARHLGLDGDLHLGGTSFSRTSRWRDSGVRDGVVLTTEPQDGPDTASQAALLTVVAGPESGRTVSVAKTTFTIGRTRGDVKFADPEVSAKHAQVTIVGDQITIADLSSTNGTYVDDVEISDTTKVLPDQRIGVGATEFTITVVADKPTEPTEPTAGVLSDGAGGLLLSPYPRMAYAADPVEISVPSPPGDSGRRPVQWLALAVPLVLSAGLAFFMQQPAMLAFAVIGPAGMAATTWNDRRSARKTGHLTQAAYEKRLQAAREELDSALTAEQAAAEDAHPEPTQLLTTATHYGRRLWERRTDDEDWLRVRIGRGDVPAATRVSQPKNGPLPAHPVLEGAPVTVDLRQQPVVGIAGPDMQRRALTRALLTSITVLHAADDVRLLVLAAEPSSAERDWACTRWLPHAGGRRGDAAVATGTQIGPACRAMLELIDRRNEARSLTHTSDERLPLPVVLLVLDGAAELRRRPEVARLLRQGPSVGIFALCLEGSAALLPEESSARIIFTSHPDRADCRIEARGASPIDAVAADQVSPVEFEGLARSISPLSRVTGDGASAVPDAVRLSDIFDLEDGLDARVREQWADSSHGTAVIGVSAKGPLTLDLEADGPHGLVVGTTGSGKSALLRGMLTSLAMQWSPAELNFLFVDFKGGDTFPVLARLPHCVGSISNLSGDAVQRTFRALDVELERRQRLFQAARADAQDFDGIGGYQQLVAETGAYPAMARLLVVLDEFAEFVDSDPELAEQLTQVARVGRSLGLHLLLATQNPNSVVSGQMRSNLTYLLCLGTAGADQSVAILDSPIAAIGKSHPGRAFARVSGGSIDEFQSAYADAPARQTAAPETVVVEDLQWSGAVATADKRTSAFGRTEAAVVVDALVRIAEVDGLRPPHRPIAEPLPDEISLASLPTDDDRSLAVGLLDDLPGQHVVPLRLAYQGSMWVIVGSAQSGRSTALRTVAVAAAIAHSPSDVHLALIDGGTALHRLSDLPHCAASADSRDPAALVAALKRLVATATERQQEVAAAGASSWLELRERGRACPPHTLVLIDRWESLRSDLDPTVLSDVERAVDRLATMGPAAGFTTLISGDETLLQAKVANRAGKRFVLRSQRNAGWNIVSSAEDRRIARFREGLALMLPDMLHVQFAVVGDDPASVAQNESVAALLPELHDKWAGCREQWPVQVKPLPKRVGLSSLRPPNDEDYVLGAQQDSPLPAVLSMRPGVALMVAGRTGTGRSTLLATIAAQAVRRGHRVLMVAVPTRSDVWSAVAGVEVVDPSETDWTSITDPTTMVLADDVDQQADIKSLVDAAKARMLTLAATADVTKFALSAPTQLAALQRAAEAKLLLCPPTQVTMTNFGMTPDRAYLTEGPAGRGVLAAGGRQTVVQVATDL